MAEISVREKGWSVDLARFSSSLRRVGPSMYSMTM